MTSELTARYLYNQAILDRLSELNSYYPDLRFFQLLIVAGIIEYDEDNHIKDLFFKESKNILIDLNNKL